MIKTIFSMENKGVLIFLAFFIAVTFQTAFAKDKQEQDWESMGMKMADEGKYSEAIQYFEKFIELSRQSQKPQDSAKALNSLGLIYSSLGQHDKSISCFEKALDIYKKLNLPEQAAITITEIGDVYNSIHKYRDALGCYGPAISIFKEFGAKYDEGVVLDKAATIYDFLGDFEKALFCRQEAIKLLKELDPESKEADIEREKAIILDNTGLTYDSLGDYEKALSYHEEALNKFRPLDLPEDTANVLHNIGFSYDGLGQYEKAIAYYEEALKADKRAYSTINAIGYAYASLGAYEKALSYYEEALKIAREENDQYMVRGILSNIAGIYLSQKKYKEAEEKFIEVIARPELYEGLKGVPFRLPELFIATGRADTALALLEGMEPGWNASILERIRFHTQKGLALKAKGRLQEASLELLKAVRLCEDGRQRIKNRTEFFASAGTFGGRILSYRSLVAALAQRSILGEKSDSAFSGFGKSLASGAFYFSELTKARTLLEAMAESARKYEPSELPLELRKKEQDILNRLSAIENNWEDAYKGGKEEFRNLLKEKEALNKELNAFVSKLNKEHPKYASLNYPRPIPAEQLPLGENEVLLEYALCDDASYIFKVRKGQAVEIIKIPKTKEEIENLVTDFCLPFEPDTKTQVIHYDDFSIRKAKGLYDTLIAEALKGVTSETNVIIVPDGILGRLPFEALAVESADNLKETVFVADKWNITYYQSATVLALNRLLGPARSSKTFFALGNPIYNKDDPRYAAYKKGKPEPVLLAKDIQRSGLRAQANNVNWGSQIIYYPLPEAEEEVKSIAGLFNTPAQPPDILLGIFANETNLRKTKLEQYHLLHFATHADLPGKVQGINEPFILLGQVENSGKDNGFLTLSKVLNLKLDADMVVLSACLTGRGKTMEGEGLLNFARAFQYAGSRAVLVSLWEISSKQTAEFMELFYQFLKDGKSKAEALSLARKQIKQRYPNPFFWAAFILHGERGKICQ